MNALTSTEAVVTVAIKMGPLWNRAVFDPVAKVVKHRGRTVCRFDEVRQLRLREYIAAYEEEQLLNAHPEVQKSPRAAELFVDLKDGKAILVAEAEQAGLLLEQVTQASSLIGAPIQTERALVGSAA